MLTQHKNKREKRRGARRKKCFVFLSFLFYMYIYNDERKRWMLVDFGLKCKVGSCNVTLDGRHDVSST
jgi:hypothetical protein